MKRGWLFAVALAMIACIAAVVVSTAADLPLTALKAVQPGPHAWPLVAQLTAPDLLLAFDAPLTSDNNLVAERDLLTRIAAYRC